MIPIPAFSTHVCESAKSDGGRIANRLQQQFAAPCGTASAIREAVSLKRVSHELQSFFNRRRSRLDPDALVGRSRR
jgi:hypothetical protein